MKVNLHVAAAVLMVAACGSSSTAATASPEPSPSPTANSPAASASPSQSPIPSFAPVASYAVLATVGTADTYTVSIVDVNGKVAASAQPSSPTQVTCGGAAAAVLPLPLSTSDTRVYFLDQQGNVDFLTPNGETGRATHVPTGGSTRSMFTVSPDDKRIAVVEDTFTTTGATTVLYAEDLNGGTNHVDLFTETGPYTLWPIGWHSTSNLVVAKVPACTQGGGPFCCGPQELHVVDPQTAKRFYILGGNGCIIAGAPSPAGVVCENTGSYTQATVLSWTAATLKTFAVQGPTPAFLSPDGSAVALDLEASSSTSFVGAKQTLNLVACGWIDSTHVIAGGDTQQQPRVADVTTGTVLPVNAQGVCAGTIPGGL